MIVDFDTANSSSPKYRRAHTGNQFASVLAQCATAPLFAPWTIAGENMRANPAAGSAGLSTHATTSNRREGRHARG